MVGSGNSCWWRAMASGAVEGIGFRGVRVLHRVVKVGSSG